MNQFVCRKCLKPNFAIFTDETSVKVKCLGCEEIQEIKIKNTTSREKRSAEKKSGGFKDFIKNGPSWAR